tara:strand:- start:113 stop:595 length:483 start_codon:yes stop_codon:yes gene_type:complete
MQRSRALNPFAWLLVVSACATSCALGNGDRRRALNYLDANWMPSTTTGRWLAAPVALPVGIVAGATDAIVLHPLSQIDDAWVDTVDVVWDFDDNTDFRTVLLVPLAAVATPVVFGVTWVFRAVFDFDDSVREAEPAEVAESDADPKPDAKPAVKSAEENK